MIDLLSEAAAVLAALIALIWQGRRARAEIDKIRADTDAVRATLTPNSGSSVRDLLDRVEHRQKEHGRSIGGIRDDLRQLRGEKEHDHISLEDRIKRLENP